MANRKIKWREGKWNRGALRRVSAVGAAYLCRCTMRVWAILGVYTLSIDQGRKEACLLFVHHLIRVQRCHGVAPVRKRVREGPSRAHSLQPCHCPRHVSHCAAPLGTESVALPSGFASFSAVHRPNEHNAVYRLYKAMHPFYTARRFGF